MDDVPKIYSLLQLLFLLKKKEDKSELKRHLGKAKKMSAFKEKSLTLKNCSFTH